MRTDCRGDGGPAWFELWPQWRPCSARRGRGVLPRKRRYEAVRPQGAPLPWPWLRFRACPVVRPVPPPWRGGWAGRLRQWRWRWSFLVAVRWSVGCRFLGAIGVPPGVVGRKSQLGCPFDGQASALVRGGGVVPFLVTPSSNTKLTFTVGEHFLALISTLVRPDRLDLRQRHRQGGHPALRLPRQLLTRRTED